MEWFSFFFSANNRFQQCKADQQPARIVFFRGQMKSPFSLLVKIHGIENAQASPKKSFCLDYFQLDAIVKYIFNLALFSWLYIFRRIRIQYNNIDSVLHMHSLSVFQCIFVVWCLVWIVKQRFFVEFKKKKKKKNCQVHQVEFNQYDLYWNRWLLNFYICVNALNFIVSIVYSFNESRCMRISTIQQLCVIFLSKIEQILTCSICSQIFL
eukprot:TRINITY_DN17457_c0_g3_i5.p2 TRINITY_DN17457_c0_g3~~TRINITY_DN17457_c0_g3_i5.p2  ORF type:complete len:210 (-),score=-0.90 TRINITY_DN17457_c0_g3_i5:625-1254(-)